MIQLKNVSFRYRGAADPALDEVTAGLRAGELVGVLGASGSGRSTLASTVTGIIPHLIRGELRGEVQVAGRETRATRPRELAGRVGLVLQDFEAQLFSTNVALEIAFGPENIGLPQAEIARRVERCLHAVDLEHLRGKLPALLSGGQKQRLALASVLALAPEILVLDEPTSDLDPAGRAALLSAVRALRESQSCGLLLIDPDTDDLGWLDRLLVLERGRLVLEGTPDELWEQPERLDALGVKPFTLARLAKALGLRGPWRDPSEAVEAIRAGGWGVAAGAAERLAAGRTLPSGSPVLEMDGVTHRYPDGTTALGGVSCTIRAGEFVAILGQNGSGKTTLAKHLNGILLSTAGTVRLHGRPLAEQSPAERARAVGLVFQNPDHQLFAERIQEEVGFGPRLQGMPEAEVARRIEESLQAVGLAGEEERDPFVLTKGGRQRVAVAATLASQPEVLILDEPTTGLDARELRGMMAMVQALNRAGHTIVIITHALEVAAAYAARTILMQGGRIVADGPTREVFADAARLEGLGLSPPPIVQVAHRLGAPALTLEELAGVLERDPIARGGAMPA